MVSPLSPKYFYKILLHNEGGDIGAKIDGASAYEWLLRKCESKVYAEADVGWMMYGTSDGEGGEDPETFLWKNAGSIHAVHYKDFKETADGAYQECTIGDGIVDVKAVFLFARAAEMIRYVDQDGSDDMKRDLKTAANRLKALASEWGKTRSTLCVLDTESGEVQKLRTFDKVIESPNWMKDDDKLVYNSGGSLYCYSISENQETLIDTGFCNQCNNDHVLSPDNTKIAVSHWGEDRISRIYTISLEEGVPSQVTGDQHSFLHGWSPDGQNQEQMTFEEQNNWFAHVSPDGKKVVNIAYSKDGLDPNEHLPNMKVSLWLMNSDGSERRKILDLFGGQGTINVNSWSQDSRRLAFVEYEMVHKAADR